MVPFIACEMSFCQNVFELMLGVNIPDPDLWIQINSVKQAIKCNLVGSGNMSQIRTSAFNNHLDYRFIASKMYSVVPSCPAIIQANSACRTVSSLMLY